MTKITIGSIIKLEGVVVEFHVVDIDIIKEGYINLSNLSHDYQIDIKPLGELNEGVLRWKRLPVHLTIRCNPQASRVFYYSNKREAICPARKISIIGFDDSLLQLQYDNISARISRDQCEIEKISNIIEEFKTKTIKNEVI